MKILKMFSMLMILGLSGNAQFIKLGVKGGANLVKIDGKSFKEKYYLGYHAGFFLELKVAGNWQLQPEIVFSESTLEASEDLRDIYGNLLDISKLNDFTLRQLNIPVLLSYQIANVLNISAGPQFSVIMDRGEGLVKNGRKAFKEGDLGWVAGLGFQIRKCRIHTRYVLGTQNLNNIDYQDKWTRQSAQISLGFVL